LNLHVFNSAALCMLHVHYHATHTGSTGIEIPVQSVAVSGSDCCFRRFCETRDGALFCQAWESGKSQVCSHCFVFKYQALL